jgi:hypothetical protein
MSCNPIDHSVQPPHSFLSSNHVSSQWLGVHGHLNGAVLSYNLTPISSVTTLPLVTPLVILRLHGFIRCWSEDTTSKQYCICKLRYTSFFVTVNYFAPFSQLWKFPPLHTNWIWGRRYFCQEWMYPRFIPISKNNLIKSPHAPNDSFKTKCMLCHSALCTLNLDVSRIPIEIIFEIFYIGLQYHKDCIFYIHIILEIFHIFIFNFDVQNFRLIFKGSKKHIFHFLFF